MDSRANFWSIIHHTIISERINTGKKKTNIDKE
jgi:hypothetical protein